RYSARYQEPPCETADVDWCGHREAGRPASPPIHLPIPALKCCLPSTQDRVPENSKRCCWISLFVPDNAADPKVFEIPDRNKACCSNFGSGCWDRHCRYWSPIRC